MFTLSSFELLMSNSNNSNGLKCSGVRSSNKAFDCESSADEKDESLEDYKLLSVIPTKSDLFDDDPCLEPAKINEKYESVDEYLNIQFRLIRQDYFSGLRQGLDDYLSHVDSNKFSTDDLRIYRNVKFIAPKKDVGTKVFFGKLDNVDWLQSERLMHGGLLMLSNDNFQNILFVIVADHNLAELTEGIVSLELCDGRAKITNEMYNSEFVMLEPKVFFEPYMTVMNAMKCMSRNHFPMKEYVIGSSDKIKLPAYLRQVDGLRYKNVVLPINDERPWPSPEELSLDESQNNAFKHALTEEFSLIQGPPGTGKTFISLEIVTTLLQNKERWRRYGPIVVVCYKNHALDQFLEGILRYTKSIVRIGNQSKSPFLQPYTLLHKRQFNVISKKNYKTRRNLRYSVNELNGIEKDVRDIRSYIKLLTTPDVIVPLEKLKRYHTDDQLKELVSNEHLLWWLLEDDGHLFLSSLQLSDDLQSGECVRVYDSIPEDFKIFSPLQFIDFKMENLEKNIAALNGLNIPIDIKKNQIIQLISYEKELLLQYQWFKDKLKKHPLQSSEYPEETNNRWQTYWNWIKCNHEAATNKIADLELRHRQERASLKKMRNLLDMSILQKHDVVGLTTTSAARLYEPLQKLHAPIVLVEEAAELFETHVISSLSKDCQHVILIGDHKQLQPKAATYEIGKNYNLNVSLFERMINMRGGSCPQLEYQHRMRQEISKLITPSIYKRLYDDASVFSYPKVKGMEKNLFFVHHNHHETNSRHNECSYVNEHEAELLMALAVHLVKQGYEPIDITVLCTYTGQLSIMQREKSLYPVLEGLQVTTVDNYQGEENKIILLSLVRNNGEGRIGFLKEENRVCVALSRAREGLYIMGNMYDLCVGSTIWPQIRQVLEDQDAIADHIEVVCEVHNDVITKIKSPYDFKKCPNGGCWKKCETRLACGHICKNICHVLDREHKEYKCIEKCMRSCPFGHPCQLECWQNCALCPEKVERKLKCGHTVEMQCLEDPVKFKCNVEVEVVLPECNHKVTKECAELIETCECTHLCKALLRCGHVCSLNCHLNDDPDHTKCLEKCSKVYRNCEKKHECQKYCYETCGLCPELVKKQRSCGHIYENVRCSLDLELELCLEPCTNKLKCGHTCTRKCSDTCRNCQVLVKKTGPCGHEVEVACSEKPTLDDCAGNCKKLLSCGHPCAKRCQDACTKKCNTIVKLNSPGLCGHTFSVPCYLQYTDSKSYTLLQYCEEPCETVLDCKHLCQGTCGKCFQGRIHVPCSLPCSITLICGHECELTCREDCLPCRKPCEKTCPHGKCSELCAIPCTPCQEKCERGCEHKKGSKNCDELCNIEPCDKPCENLLKCEHPCIGFCGEPCPSLCRICDKGELESFSNNEDARFIYLKDCGHCIENNELISWIESDAVSVKTCPRCKSEIRNCWRISNQNKILLKDIICVKRKLNEDQVNTQKMQMKCLESLEVLRHNLSIRVFGVGELSYLLEDMKKRGKLVKDNNLSKQEIEAFEIQMEILNQISIILTPADDQKIIKSRIAKLNDIVKDQVLMLVKSIPKDWQMSKQTLADIQLELQRLNYMVQTCNLCNSNHRGFEQVKALILTPQRFTKELETQVISEIEKILQKKLTVIELRAIAKTPNLNTPGHWFKCLNDHVFAIAEGDDATQTRKCPSCSKNPVFAQLLRMKQRRRPSVSMIF